jgi:hypothetical protein
MLAQTVVSLPTSAFPPLAVGFMGLGTGYLIYGPQELFHWPKRSDSVNLGTGIWGIWMPGFMQFFTGVYLFAGLALFGTFKAPILYMAALAFTAYGVHWFAIGYNRMRGADSRTSIGMTVGFTLISILGIIAFVGAHDVPVGGLFIGLTCIYVSDFFATLAPQFPKVGRWGERFLGFFHLGTGFWLFYLMFAVVLDFVLKFSLTT